MSDMNWWDRFPALGPDLLGQMRREIDGAFRQFSREYGEVLEDAFEPLQAFLLASERLLTQSPWPLVLIAIAAVVWLASRKWVLVAGAMVLLGFIGVLGMWDDTMKTLAMIFVCTVLALVLGVPMGIAMSRWDRLQRIVNPALDILQTMPSFVYLIPVVMILGIGRVPGLIAVVMYAIPPVIRFTNLGIRLVDKDLLEVADAYGASMWQRLRFVQLPLALPTIMAGVNQTIMLSLSMVVIASMIGVPGLGQPVLKAISNQYFTMGILNGLAIVGIAMLFDTVSQSYGLRLQKHLEARHG